MEHTITDSIQQMLNEMECCLCADITLEEWAAKFGYSPWHFTRLFQKTVGMPLMQYRTRRRLMHALYAVSQGEPIVDAALRYGFNTHVGFFKAFLQEYGCSPTQYIRHHRVLPPRPLILKEERYPMISNIHWKQALTCWGMDLPLSPIIFPGSGRINESCRKAGDQYLLKAYTDLNKCRMQTELAKALKEQNLPAAIPLPNPQGEIIVQSDNLYFTLSQSIEGNALRADQLLNGDIPENGKRIGEALSKLHHALDQMENCPITDRQDLLGALRGWALPRVRALGILDDAWLHDYEQAIAARFPHLPAGPIHRDPNPSNLILTKDQQIGFMDFDLAECNVRLFDPCYAATAVLSECFSEKEKWPDLFQGIISGYHDAHPFLPQEIESAHFVALAIEMICIAAFEGKDKYQDIFSANVNMLKWMKALPIMTI